MTDANNAGPLDGRDKLVEALEQAFVTSISEGHPDASERRYRLVFAFPDMNSLHVAHDAWVNRRALSSRPDAGEAFQQRVQPWMMECFGAEISADMLERADRFVEEALELAQTMPGFTAARAHALVDYVFGRPVGERAQEVGGVMVTLAALCLAANEDMHEAAEIELARISQPETVAKIRAKQAAKPTGSALPIAHQPDADRLKYEGDVIDAVQRLIEQGRATVDSEGYLVAHPPAAVGDYRELIAYNIIQGSAGIRAAEHAKDFKTGNWADALRSADAVISAVFPQPASHPAAADEGRLRTAVEGIADDYMTSDTHHPGYVLIPTAKFDQIVSSLTQPAAPQLSETQRVVEWLRQTSWALVEQNEIADAIERGEHLKGGRDE